MIGEVLGGYELTRKLGEGDTGESYLAVHHDSGQRAAAKVLLPRFCSDLALIDRLFAEVKAASLLGQVGLASLHGCGFHGSGRAFLLMEYLEGKTLTDALIELGSVSDIESLADIAWQLATLLGAAHASQLVHGALKPDAIFLTFPEVQAPRPLVKLLDFGMSRFSLDVRHSQTGSLLGAPLYMSPEMGRGLGKVDHRADIYSLGCILFEMACGRPPFVREGKGELVIAHSTEMAPAASSLEPSLPSGVDTLIGRMLTKSPDARPQTMAEVAAVLEKFFSLPAPAAAQALPPVPLSLSSPFVAAASISLGPQVLEPPPAPPAIPATTPRRQDPTALLPPAPQVWPSQLAPAGARVPGSQAWVSRVHQRTMILDPLQSASASSSLASARLAQPSGGSPSPGRGRESVASRSPRQMRSPGGTEAPPSSLSLPIVILSASVVLAAGAAALLLKGRRTALAPASTVPAASPTVPRRPAPPAYDDAGPRVQLAKSPLPPAPNPRALTDSTPADSSDARDYRPTLRPGNQVSGKPESGSKKRAPLW